MFAIAPYESARFADPFHGMNELARRFFGENMPFELRTDVTDLGDAYLLEADLPGFARKDIHLDVTGDVLRVRAERRSSCDEEDDQHRLIRSERGYGSYCREFDLNNVDAQAIRARYEDGVLKLTLPKKQTAPAESRTLEIE